jgi:hypothetical protein
MPMGMPVMIKQLSMLLIKLKMLLTLQILMLLMILKMILTLQLLTPQVHN